VVAQVVPIFVFHAVSLELLIKGTSRKLVAFFLDLLLLFRQQGCVSSTLRVSSIGIVLRSSNLNLGFVPCNLCRLSLLVVLIYIGHL